MTKLAIISDIHGNSVALKAIFEDMDNQGDIDQIINLGDLVVFGPDPAGVLTLLAERSPMWYVRGNTDRYLAEESYPRGNTPQSWEEQVLASFPWTAEQLSHADLQFLGNLPQQQYLCFDERLPILAVHGSPYSDEDNIRPDTAEAVLNQWLPAQLDVAILLCGHTHVPVNRMVAGRHIINVGSVGLPFDGDPRASYLLLDIRPDSSYRFSFRRVAYDVEAVVRQLKAVAHPTTAISTYNLRSARPLGTGLIYTEEMRQGHQTSIV